MTLRFSDSAMARLLLRGTVCALLLAPGVRNLRAQSGASTLSLSQAVTLALQNSPDLKLARVQYNVAKGEVGVDKAAFLPNLYTGSGAAYTYGFPSLPGGNAPALFQLDYSQTIFNPLLKSQQHAAEDRAKNMQLEMDRVREDVTARTATTYLELAKVRHSLELLSSEQASAEKISDVTRERVQASQELPIEQTRSDLALAQVHERTVKLQDRNEVLSRQLRDLTGMPDAAELEVDEKEQTFAANLEGQSDGQITALAIQNDRSLAEAENDRDAQQKLLHGAKLSYFPTVDLVGQYSILSKFNNYDQFYTSFQRNNLNVGVQITIPIFAARTNANAALAKSQLEASETTLENKRRSIREGSEDQQRDLREVAAARDVARLALQLAQETLQLQQARLQQGQATLGDVERAQLDQSEKWIDFLDAEFAQQKAQIAVLQSTGQLAKVLQ